MARLRPLQLKPNALFHIQQQGTLFCDNRSHESASPFLRRAWAGKQAQGRLAGRRQQQQQAEATFTGSAWRRQQVSLPPQLPQSTKTTCSSHSIPVSLNQISPSSTPSTSSPSPPHGNLESSSGLETGGAVWWRWWWWWKVGSGITSPSSGFVSCLMVDKIVTALLQLLPHCALLPDPPGSCGG